jgi:hypothetical protein
MCTDNRILGNEENLMLIRGKSGGPILEQILHGSMQHN